MTRRIDLADLVNERWILTAPETWNYEVVGAAFQMRGLPMPDICVKTLSLNLRTSLVAAGDDITALPKSVVRICGDQFALKVLPIDLPALPWPVEIVTLRDRTLGPLIKRFIACAHEVAAAWVKGQTELMSRRRRP